MPTLTQFDPTNPTPFLTEAKAQIAEARARMKRAWLEAAGAAFCFVLWISGVFPWWVTFTLWIVVGVAAVQDWQRSISARQSALIAFRFHAGLDE